VYNMLYELNILESKDYVKERTVIKKKVFSTTNIKLMHLQVPLSI